MKKEKLTGVIKSMRSYTKKHSPEILTGIGIAGMITAVILGIKATPKAMDILEKKKKELDTDSLSKKETVKAVWAQYVPTTIAVIASASCIVGAQKVNAKRSAAIAAAYTLSETARKEYADKVVELLGEKKDKSIKDSIAKDKIDRNPVKEEKIIITEQGGTLCYDALSGRYFKSDIEKLRRAENELNHRMLSEMYISLNELYYEIGLGGIRLGDELGWNINDGLIKLEFSSQLAEDGTPCLVVRPSEPPHYDFT